MNVLPIKKPTAAAVSPHRRALADNLLAIRDTRAKLNGIVERDRAAAADQALCDATSAQMASLQQEVDTLRANAVYAGASPPDVSRHERQLTHLQQLLKRQTDTARAATLARAKYAADISKLNDEVRDRAKLQPKLLFDSLREDCLASLAEEFLAAEAALLAIHRRVFAAALAVDVIAMEHSFGEFVQSGNINALHISRPNHPAFTPVVLTPEGAVAAKRRYATDTAADADTLVHELLND